MTACAAGCGESPASGQGPLAGAPLPAPYDFVVQGAEDRVLAGAEETLRRTRSLFLEVATSASPYVGGATFERLHAAARGAGFRLAALGTDPENGEGNAFWVR